jgi:hypothetical protein
VTRPAAIGSGQRSPSFAAPWPVLLVAATMVGVLLVLSGAYGFHRDELYFIVAGRHPALGYVDQPAFTPLLSAASVALLGLTPTAVRTLPALAMGLTVVLIALMAGDLSGSRRAQVPAAVIAALSGYLAAGHADSTATFDFLAWAVVLWLLVKLLAGGDRRLWLGVGLAVGIGLENKDTLIVLGAGLVVGFLLSRRWDVFRSPWPWAALGLAVLLWLPNLAWQAANGWPQISMAGAISGDAGDNRASLVPQLLLGAGLLLFPVVGIGWAWFLLSAEARPWRPIGIAGIVVVALVFLSGGKGYYAVGIVAPYMAAAGVLVDRWIARGHGRLKGLGFIALAAMSGALVAYVTLPILSPAAFARTTLPAADPVEAEQVGWPELVTTVERVVDTLPAAERTRAMILTGNYGEAGALQLLGTDLPPVYSGHNAYWDWGPPPADRDVVIRVGEWPASFWSRFYQDCEVAATIENSLGIDNQEAGQHIYVCRGMLEPWAAIWPQFRHLD